jgi:hypothetical protein
MQVAIVIHWHPIQSSMSPPHVTAIFIVFLTLLSCSSTPRPDIILHEGPEGGVYLEFLPDRKLRAAQPIKLDRGLVARILNGIQVGEPKTAVQTLFSNNVKPERVFSDEDTSFLAPLISSALSRATADQQVRFRVVHLVSPIAHPSDEDASIGSSTPQTGGLQKETTAGTLYAYGRSLYVTLDEYRHRAIKSDVIGEPNRYYSDPKGLKEREVQFVPQPALRPDSYKHSEDNTLVIDYDMLAKRPLLELENSVTVPAAATSAPVSASTEAPTHVEDQPIMPPSISSEPIKPRGNSVRENDEVRQLKDLVIKKDLELEALKKELRSLRRQLSEREAQLDALRKKGKTSPKSSETLP